MTNSTEMPSLVVGDLKCRLPIIQGGMGVGISFSGLASAVAKEGGVGVIAATGIGMYESDIGTNYNEANDRALRKEIRKFRKNTDGLVGINILVALTDFRELIWSSVDEGADFVFMGAGLPLKLPKEPPFDDLNKVKTKLVPIVSSSRAVKLLFQYWAKNYNYIPDALVVEGPLAGGHIGFKREQIDDPNYSLESLVTQIIKEKEPFEKQFNKHVPIIAAGGIYTGADIKKFLQLGAEGVQMATRFVPTHECDASPEFKETFVNCKKEDIVIIDSPVGMPGRAIKNQFLIDVSNGIKKPFVCPWKCLITCDYKNVPYCIALALTNAKRGNMKGGFPFAGANAYRTEKISSIKEVFDALKEEYAKA